MSSTSRHPREREVFLDALECASPEARRRFLDEACGGQPGLRSAVESLLAAHGDPDFLASLPEGSILPAHRRPADLPGEQIGPYTLVRLLGEGGFGRVHLAEQRQPIVRQVALKILHPGLDSASIVTRFDAERRVLARLDHPGLARIHDAGTTEHGRPYFAMEYIPGAPITEFCRERRLSLPRRLELFVAVCRAVHHAHQRGILHRDLKPSNILVTETDGVPTPKVIDFGIAKALEAPLTPPSASTLALGLLGTPPYMSPEQADLGTVDSDTRSDLFSLGVVLHELLTGTTPLDRHSLSGIGLDELRRRIREHQPEPPSKSVGRLKPEAAAALIHGLGTSLSQHRSRLRGDLDWIVLKCLEREPQERYASVAELAADLGRHLAQEPVLAGPRSTAYVLRKFVRRNRSAVAALGAVLAAMAFGLTLAAWQYREKARALVRATRAEQEQGQLRKKAETQAAVIRRHAYAADINLIQAALWSRNFAAARPLLAAWIPGAGEPDIRGWEWFYLSAQCADQRRGEFARLPHPVASLGFSHDGKLLSSGLENGRVSIWDFRERVPLKEWTTRRSLPLFAFSPASPWFAFADSPKPGDGDGPPARVRLWRPDAPEAFVDVPLDAPCAGLAFDDTRHRLWTATAEGAVTSWTVPGLTRIATSRLPRPQPDGPPPLLVPALEIGLCADDKGAFRIVDFQSGESPWDRRIIRPDGFTAVAVDVENRYLAFAIRDGVGPRLFALANGMTLPVFGLVSGQTHALQFLRSPTRLLFAGMNQTLSVADLPGDYSQITRMPPMVPARPDGAPRPRDLRKAPELPFQPTVAPNGGAGSPIPAGPVTVRHLRGQDSEILSLAVHPDGRTIATGARDGSIALWNLDDARPDPESTALWTNIVAWAFRRPDGSKPEALLTADDLGSIVERAVAPGVPHRELMKLGPEWKPFSFDRDGRLLALRRRDSPAQWGVVDLGTSHVRPVPGDNLVGTATGMFTERTHRLVFWHAARRAWATWEFGAAQTVAENPIPEAATPAQPPAVACSRDERRWAWIAVDGRVWFRESPSRPPRLVALPPGGYHRVAFSPDARTLIALRGEGTAVAWDLSRDQLRATLRGPLSPMQAAAFSEDGERLVTTAEREPLRIWDTESFRELISIRPLSGLGTAFAEFSPSGTALACWNSDGQLMLWHPPIRPPASKDPR